MTFDPNARNLESPTLQQFSDEFGIEDDRPITCPFELASCKALVDELLTAMKQRSTVQKNP